MPCAGGLSLCQKNAPVGLVVGIVLMAIVNVVTAQTNESLRNELLRMREADQTGREKIQAAGREHGFDSPEVEALWEIQREVDIKNLERLEEIIAKYGWPGQSLVGRDAATAAFLIIQHADHETQVQYLPVIERAVESGELEGQALALLQDRILIAEGEKQQYGTQLRRNEETGTLELFPIENRANVDERRAKLGMRPLEEYLRMVRGEGG